MITPTKPTRPQTNDWVEQVVEIVKRGNVAEVKREKDNIVVVEIHRQLKSKTAISG